MEIAEYLITIGAVGTALSTMYLLGGHGLRVVRKSFLAQVDGRLATLEKAHSEIHSTIFANDWGIRNQVSDLRQRVATLEGYQDGAASNKMGR